MGTERGLARTLAVAAALWIGACPVLSADNHLAIPQEARSYGVDVGLVRLSVTARSAPGALVHDLASNEFQVAEDGTDQEVVRFGHHEAPISVAVLLDKSQSMEDEKLMHAKDAVVSFAKALRPEDEVLLIAFSRGIDVLGDFGLDLRTIERATKRIRVASSTRLYDAVVEGARAISGPDRKEKRALLVLSDGADTASEATLQEAVEAVRRAGVPVYAIGIEMEEEDRTVWFDPPWRRLSSAPQPLEALHRLTDGTGGWTYAIKAAKRCREVCVRVAEELRHQYLLGYAPRGGGAPAWRSVTVRTSRPNVTLETRAGYYAGAR